MKNFKAYAKDILSDELYVVGGTASCRKEFIQTCKSKGFMTKWYYVYESFFFDQIYLCKDNAEIGGFLYDTLPPYMRNSVLSKPYIDVNIFYRVIDNNYYRIMRAKFFKSHIFKKHIQGFDSGTNFWFFEDGEIWEESQAYIYGMLHRCITNSVDDVIYYLCTE